MSARLRSLDHFVILVGNLEDAAKTYRRLGFHVRPSSRHIELKSSNSIVHFPNSYVELLDLSEALAPLRGAYRSRSQFGEGLANVSLNSRDIDGDHRSMQEHGLEPAPIRSARRKVTLPDASQAETESSFFYLWRSANRYLSLFFTEHRKPETIFIAEFGLHPNTAAEVSRVVYMSRDPALDVDYFANVFGTPPAARSEDGFLMVGARGDLTEVLSVAAARHRYGASLPAQTCEPLAGLPVALHFAISSMDRCCAWFANSGIPHEKHDTAMVISAADAHGCALAFERGNAWLTNR